MKHRPSLGVDGSTVSPDESAALADRFTMPAEQPIAVRVFREGSALDVRVDLH